MQEKKFVLRLRRLLVPAAVLWAVAIDFHGDPTQYFTYFTVLTNLSIGLWFLAAAVAPERAERLSTLRLALTVYGLVTLLVYWILLSPTHHPQGWTFFATVILHLVVPVAMAAEDVLVPWPRTKPSVPLWILIFPLSYCAFAVVRGLLTGWYPYFFLDQAAVGGWLVFSAFFVGLLSVFAGLGAAWRLLVHRRHKPGRKKTTAR